MIWTFLQSLKLTRILRGSDETCPFAKSQIAVFESLTTNLACVEAITMAMATSSAASGNDASIVPLIGAAVDSYYSHGIVGHVFHGIHIDYVLGVF